MIKPLTPADCDLKDFAFMPIEVSRFLDSSFNATLNDMAWRAGVTLWLKSWHQVPAASLPDDEATLANFAGFGRDVKTWRKIRAEAMRGWEKAEDGLWYHPVVAEKALEAWLEKLAQRLSSGAGNATRWGAAFDPEAIEAQIAVGVALLSALNPNSKTLAKKRKKPPAKTADGIPTGLPPGGGSAIPVIVPSGLASGVPSGSQETGTLKGQGSGESISNETLSPDARAAWEEFRGLYPRLRLDDAKGAFDVVAAELGDPAPLVAALRAVLPDWKAQEKPGDAAGRWAPKASKFLGEGLWRGYLGAPAAVRSATGIGGTHTGKWTGPASIRDAVLKETSPGFVASFLDTATWTPGEGAMPGAITTAFGEGFTRLIKLRCLADLGISIFDGSLRKPA